MGHGDQLPSQQENAEAAPESEERETAKKQVEVHIARLKQLEGPDHSRVRTRIFRKIGRLKAKLNEEEAKAAQKKRRKRMLFGEQGSQRKDTRPKRLRLKQERMIEAVVLVGGLPWDVHDMKLRGKCEKTGKVTMGEIIKCQV